jgi:hypothetical protein
MYMSVDNADETAQLVVDAAKDFYKPPICPRSTSVLGPTASEDRHPTGPNKQSGGDQDDAQDQLALDQLHNADHDKDGGNNPQNGCTHGAILTLGSPALSPLLPGRLRSRGLLQTEHRFGSVSSPSGRGRPSLRGGCYNQLCNPSDGGTWVDAGVGVHGSRFASWNGRTPGEFVAVLDELHSARRASRAELIVATTLSGSRRRIVVLSTQVFDGCDGSQADRDEESALGASPRTSRQGIGHEISRRFAGEAQGLGRSVSCSFVVPKAARQDRALRGGQRLSPPLPQSGAPMLRRTAVSSRSTWVCRADGRDKHAQG